MLRNPRMNPKEMLDYDKDETLNGEDFRVLKQFFMMRPRKNRITTEGSAGRY